METFQRDDPRLNGIGTARQIMTLGPSPKLRSADELAAFPSARVGGRDPKAGV